MPKGKKKGKYDHKRTEVYSSDEDAGIDMGDNYSETSGQSDMKSTHDDAGKTQDPQQNVPTTPSSPLSDDVLYLCTYNIMSLSTEERLVELTHCLKNIKWDVIGLAEVKRIGEIIVEFDDFILCYVGTVPGLYGVGFLVKKYLVGSIVSFVPVSDRVAVLVLDVKENIISLIQVYAPTEFSNRQDLAIFYHDLNKAMNMCEGHILVMGDLNARIGQCESTYEFRVVGNHGYGLRSNRGNILLQFCLDNQLKVINTFFIKNPNKKWTRQSLDGRSKCELDYVLCKSTNIFTNIEVIHLKFSSDHRLIRSTIKLGKKKSPKKLLIKNVKQENAPNSETNSIGEFKIMIADYNTCETYQELYDFIEMVLIKYTDLLKQINVILPSSVNKYCSPAEISKDSIDLLNIRQKLRNKSERSKEERQQLTTVVKELNSSIENDVTNYKLQYLIDAEETSEALKKINEQKLWITCLKDEYGDKVYKRNYIMEIATNYFRKLYSHRLLDEESSYLNQTMSQISDLNHNILEFLDDEISFSIRNCNKYVCNDDVIITKELIVHLEPYLSKPLQKLFNLILKEQKVPRQWLSLTLSVQYKNGDPSLLTSYNTTASIPIIYQIFSNTLVNRISRSIDEMATVEQAYSRNKLTKLDHIYVLSQVIEKYNILKKPLYVAFVNYTEPYNSMFPEAIWTALRDIQVETNYVNLYKYIYENMNAKMRLDRVGTEFKVKTGMRQEDPSTAKLFSAVLDYIFRQFDWSNKGININGRYLSYLICKDVVLLMSEEGNEMQEMLDTINNNSRHAGLVIDTSKTKVMTNSSKVNITVNGNILEYVKDYIYLGHLVSFENNMKKVIDLRLKSAKSKFRDLKFVFESHLNMEFKKSIFASHVLPYLIYGCETWSLRKTDETRLKNCHKTMENSMANSLVANQTGLPDVMHAIRVKKWLWVGEVMRATDNRWSREVMEWYQPKKSRSKTWSADLASVAGKTWPRQAQDAYVWKRLEEKYLNI